MTNLTPVVMTVLMLVVLALACEHTERWSKGRGTRFPDRMLLRTSGFLLGLAVAAVIVWKNFSP